MTEAGLQAQATRLNALNDLLDATGQEKYMYEDWVEVTLDLIQTLSNLHHDSALAKEKLFEIFNDLESANAITQHFRVCESLRSLV